MPRHGHLGEFELIESLLAPLTLGAPGAFGLTDDAALITPRDGKELVVTTDAMVAGVHFLPDDPPGDIGRKLLRVSLSDLAGMGAAPEAYLLTLALTGDTPRAWIEAFVAGLADDQARFGVHLIGGDTVSSPGVITVSLTAMGWVQRGQALRRAGARPGDDIYVSGSVGDGCLGLAVAKGALALGAEAERYLLLRLRRPEPRVELGRGLIGPASACTDVSDGLVADIGHICAASGVGATIQARAIPLSDIATAQVTAGKDLLIRLMTGGDDYELVFTVPPSKAGAIEPLGRRLAVRLTKIGRITEGQGVHVVDEAGRELAIERRGYVHFSGSD